MYWAIGVVAVLISFLFAPNGGGTEARNDGCIIFAPQTFVREKVLDYRYMRQLQASSGNPHIVAPFVTQKHKQKQHEREAGGAGEHGTLSHSALDAVVGDTIVLSSPSAGADTSLSKIPPRLAKVERNSFNEFVFTERLPLFQRIEHSMSFSQWDGREDATVFQHRRQWSGSLALLWLRKCGLLESSGDGSWSSEKSMKNAGTETVRVAVGEAFEQENGKGS